MKDHLFLFKKSGAVVKILYEHQEWMIDKPGDPDCTVVRVDSGKEMLVHRAALIPLKQVWMTDDESQTEVKIPPRMTQPYAVFCPGLDFTGCGKVEFGQDEYERQMSRPGQKWRCPKCGCEARFDDDHYEAMNL